MTEANTNPPPLRDTTARIQQSNRSRISLEVYTLRNRPPDR